MIAITPKTIMACTISRILKAPLWALRIGPKRCSLSVPLVKSPTSFAKLDNICKATVVSMAHTKVVVLKKTSLAANKEPSNTPDKDKGNVLNRKLVIYARTLDICQLNLEIPYSILTFQLPPLTPPYTGGGYAALKHWSASLRPFPLLCKEGLGKVVFNSPFSTSAPSPR